MIAKEIRDKYSATIGIECHVQLKTKSKLFSAVGNDAREAPPNSLVSHIDFGLPGALPVLNREAVNLAMKAAFALGSVPQPFSKFDRKHYFYPDLPMGYQITQYDQPIILGGEVEIEIDGVKLSVGITRAHLEADAGKSVHPANKDYSLVDLNRAGTPLLEIVSEPDMHSSAEAKAYARELYLRMKYAGVSDANLFYGNMRFDVNVSVSVDPAKLGTRTETKNLNSFRIVEKAVDYEINRQIEALEKGEAIVQETRGWDDAKQKTFAMRSKENADDYRYMPDPDIPPVLIPADVIEAVKTAMPILPADWRWRLNQMGLDQAQIETLIDAEVEDGQANYLALIEMSLEQPDFAKFLANWFVNLEIPLHRETEEVLKLGDYDRFKSYSDVYVLVGSGKLSSTKAKALLIEILKANAIPPDIAAYAESQGFIQLSDETEISQLVDQVIKDNPKAADDVKKGETKATQFLIGQVMKLSRGKANPSLTQELIKQKLGG